MAINGYRNKPIGPGGGTRRLHHQLIRTSVGPAFASRPQRSGELLLGAK